MKKSKPIEIVKGKTYKNFKEYFRTVICVTENMVTYVDGTGLPRTCEIDSFRQWIKKNYY